MARRKTLPQMVRTKCSLAERLSKIRGELFGDRGGPEMARRLGLPVRTWYNYEAGVTVPAEVVLKIIEMTSVEPMWLLHGRGPKYRPRLPDVRTTGHGTSGSVGALLRTALQILEQDELSKRRKPGSKEASEEQPAPSKSDDIVLIAVNDTGRESLTEKSGPRYLAARSEWLDAQRDCRCILNLGDAMAPIVADGAYVSFSGAEDRPEDLDGKLVVAWVEGEAIIRWFQHCGRYGLLRAENPATNPGQVLIDLEAPASERRFRRVLWITTPH